MITMEQWFSVQLLFMGCVGTNRLGHCSTWAYAKKSITEN